MMDWAQLLSTKRFGQEENFQAKTHDVRTEFQRDFDRLIFSSPFRRLQNKTQVFPLPGSVFVHNRLTHSLEVSCVGRSLGNLVYEKLKAKKKCENTLLSEISSIVSAACLAHDLGNPPFGHSGENAIATYFSEGKGTKFQSELSFQEWADFVHFEGNANAFRLLTNQFKGRRNGGFVLTYSTLAAVVKYPYEAQFADEKKQKFGFFQSEKNSFEKIAADLGIAKNARFPNRFVRHPLVFLVEAADDICYQIMDIEDAFKLKILDYRETVEILISFIKAEKKDRSLKIINSISDKNEQIAYLRSAVVGNLVEACAEIFVANEEAILRGEFEKSLMKNLPENLKLAYDNSCKISFDKIYRSQVVVDVELAGYQIIMTLLENLLEAVFNPEKAYSKQLLRRIPEQYDVFSNSLYSKIQAVLDYISGMTDVYALDLYRKINGMSLPTL